MTLQTLVFIPVFLAAGGLAGYRFFVLFKMMKALTGKGPSVDRIGARIWTTIEFVLGQRAVLRSRAAGIMHAIIFWGFIIITTGTVEQFATTIYPPLHFDFIGHAAYSVLAFAQDFFTVAVLLAVLYAAYRRFIVRPAYLGQSRDANLILVLTGSLMVAILFMDGFTFAAEHPWFESSKPFAGMISAMIQKTGMSEGTALQYGITFKWIHMLLVLGFGIYIPGSKHLHVMAAGPNTFLRKPEREKGMKTINFEDEKITQYGTAKVGDLNWKDALDLYSCTECGRCENLCPAHNTGKPLSPKNLIVDIKHNLFGNKAGLLAGKADATTPLIDQHVTEDVIWACTSCRACEIACPVFIEHTDKIYDIRRNLVMMESKFPAEVQTVFKNMETNGTPWAFNASERTKWTEGLNIKTAAEEPSFDVLFWVGCAGAFDERNKKVARAFASLLKKAGIRFGILGTEETCTGDSARRIGNEYLFQTLAKANIETLGRYKVKNIVTTCPHCFNTLKNEYKDFGGDYHVEHHSQYIARLIREGKLKPTKP